KSLNRSFLPNNFLRVNALPVWSLSSRRCTIPTSRWSCRSQIAQWPISLRRIALSEEGTAMDNDYKTKLVEPQQSIAVADVEQPPDDELAAKALEEIHSTERLSGFGRFAMKLQNVFQASKASQSKQGLSHLKAAPIMMSAGLLLLFATGLLFLLSKPESAVPSHFRQPTVLAGTDRQKTALTVPTESPVTEDQLAGRDVNTDAGVTGSSSKKQGID